MDSSGYLDLLTEAGFKVVPRTSRDLTIDNGNPVTARVITRQRIPRPENIHRDLQANADADILLYLLPRTNQTIRMITQSNPRLAAVGLEDRVVIFQGEMIALDHDHEKHSAVRRRPWGRFATVRELIRNGGRQPSQTAIADQTGISQAAVSQALKYLRDQHHIPIDQNHRDGPRSFRALIDYAITEYPGPGGITSYWYDFDHPTDTAHKLREVLRESHALVGGDLAADEYAPWKSTTRLALYFPTGIDMTRYHFAEAPADEANIVLRIPADTSVFRTATAWNERTRPESPFMLTDPVITAWELTQSPDTDAGQAVDHLKDFLENGQRP
jgi:biotin operon repressor